jgi:hypothetical protein
MAAGSVGGSVWGLRQVGFKERVDVDHVAAHVVCPFQYLLADVDEECFGRPSSEEHDLGGGYVLEEECHCGTRSDGLIPYFFGVKAEGGFATEVLARGA